MKLKTHKTLLLILIALALGFAGSPLTAQVYKTVDKDGNVTYTDQPPKDGSAPIKLREISVIEAPTYSRKPAMDKESAAPEEGEEKSLKYLRNHYRDFAIIAPKPEESLWPQEQAITVAWNTQNQLEFGMQVTVIIDGKEHITTPEQVIPVNGLERGSHTITANLKDAANRTIASTAPVTFFVRRPSVFINNANSNG